MITVLFILTTAVAYIVGFERGQRVGLVRGYRLGGGGK